MKPVQVSLGLVAPHALGRLSPSQRTMLARAGSLLSRQQQQAARRRAQAQEAEHRERTGEAALDFGVRLRRIP